MFIKKSNIREAIVTKGGRINAYDKAQSWIRIFDSRHHAPDGGIDLPPIMIPLVKS